MISALQAPYLWGVEVHGGTGSPGCVAAPQHVHLAPDLGHGVVHPAAGQAGEALPVELIGRGEGHGPRAPYSAADPAGVGEAPQEILNQHTRGGGGGAVFVELELWWRGGDGGGELQESRGRGRDRQPSPSPLMAGPPPHTLGAWRHKTEHL